MGNGQMTKERKKNKRIGKKVGNVVVIMQAISVVFAVAICVWMYNSLVRSMQERICTNGTNALAYELSRATADDDKNAMLDGLKERMGCEFTIFEGDTRAYSTVTQNGERVVGTKLASNLCDIVLEQGQTYVGEADILGVKYLCSYVPTKGTDGKVDGLIFAGISIAEAEEETARIITYAIAVSILVIIACIIFLTAYLKMRVSGPLGKITQAAMQLEKGELGLADGREIQLDVRSNDEIGLLGDIFENTIGSLRAYIGEISDILGAIAKGDLTRSAQQEYAGDFLTIKNSLDRILGALNQTMGQIAASANHVADGSDQVSASARQTSNAAAEVGSFVNQAGAQLGISIESVKELSESMEQISSDSKQISTIIATIENIAFQINILSLNAAVEAARAGTAGKGFAVVADEISSLASKSDEAAKATKELIESSAATIKEGGKVMNRVSEALERTGQLAGNVTIKMEQVVEAVEKQTVAMEQVATGVEQISAVVENNSATSQECAAASEELSSQSGLLKELIGTFRIRRH